MEKIAIQLWKNTNLEDNEFKGFLLNEFPSALKDEILSYQVNLADDDVSVRTVLSQAVSRAGCRVKSTGAISTLWRWIEEGEGDAIILDVVLPDGDALDILPALKKKRPELPVIVISANNTILTTKNR